MRRPIEACLQWVFERRIIKVLPLACNSRKCIQQGNLHVRVYLLVVCIAMVHARGTALLLCQSKKGVRHIEQLKFIPKLDVFFITVHLFGVYLNLENDGQSR